jgi:hypothetical protein
VSASRPRRSIATQGFASHTLKPHSKRSGSAVVARWEPPDRADDQEAVGRRDPSATRCVTSWLRPAEHGHDDDRIDPVDGPGDYPRDRRHLDDLQHPEPLEHDAQRDAQDRHGRRAEGRGSRSVHAVDQGQRHSGELHGRVNRCHASPLGVPVSSALRTEAGNAGDGYGVISTGVPSGTSSSGFRSSLWTRTQPCEMASPRSLGLEVPWTASSPPGQSERTARSPTGRALRSHRAGTGGRNELHPHVECRFRRGGADTDPECSASRSWT